MASDKSASREIKKILFGGKKGTRLMSRKDKVVRFGLIGCGRVTETCHLPALQNLVGAEVVAVADIDPQRLNRMADRFHVKHRYTDFHALLNDPAIEVVGVCVPAQFHVEVAWAALDAEKHLLIEKPLAVAWMKASD
jgi:predicted dehydrogenase